ncbi:Crp/Fnr family transcriptional regulator [Aurantiacibacter rhizosphaerae]|uniref:Helix-turn-helix domain-containing protein n=1 Tax=Aurantiacibacter rhizosphaerae TaxID=2691582 RepID=A0A844XBF4_9SPHN|nr:Crp/Fnr family transcriptional regulator [Aurantiacibacter rhizosphaerae]MWV27113.1 helix-turn-helix domain-containing protein [Aurantiacibacter rhizosphaerae]
MDAKTGDVRLGRFPLTGDFLAGRLRRNLSLDDLTYIEELVENVETHEDGARLLARGTKTDRSTILIEGYIFRTIEIRNKRFITGVHVPGDFVDLHGFALKRLDHNIDAAGQVKVGCVSHETLRTVMRDRPGVARAMWFATLLDAAIHRKWIQTLEQLDAPRRIAHLYSELYTRLNLVGREVTRALRTPFTQFDMADMCGVSAIHANRAVGKLRDLGIAEIRRGDLYTNDWDALKEYAQFDPDYLYGDGPLKVKEDWD